MHAHDGALQDYKNTQPSFADPTKISSSQYFARRSRISSPSKQQATMSGRGKGGKGLGKGGAKRHRKVLRDNIQGEHTLLLCS